MSQDKRQTSADYFLPEWVVGVLYMGEWHEVAEGTLKEGVETERGTMTVYADQYSGEIVFLKEEITGYRIKPREFRPVVIPEYPDILDD